MALCWQTSAKCSYTWDWHLSTPGSFEEGMSLMTSNFGFVRYLHAL